MKPIDHGYPMRFGFVNTVSAFCYTVLHEEPRQLTQCCHRDVSMNVVTNFVLDQHARMPDYLRHPFFVLTLIFNLAGFVHGGSLFHRMDRACRQRQIESWRNSKIGVLRDFVRFHESLAVFCWYSMLGSVADDHRRMVPAIRHQKGQDASTATRP